MKNKEYPLYKVSPIRDFKRVITAEIFPEEDYWAKSFGREFCSGGASAFSPEPECGEYYQKLMMRKNNHGRPVYKRMSRVILRGTEFEKNASRKMVRQQGQNAG